MKRTGVVFERKLVPDAPAAWFPDRKRGSRPARERDRSFGGAAGTLQDSGRASQAKAAKKDGGGRQATLPPAP